MVLGFFQKAKFQSFNSFFFFFNKKAPHVQRVALLTPNVTSATEISDFSNMAERGEKLEVGLSRCLYTVALEQPRKSRLFLGVILLGILRTNITS